MSVAEELSFALAEELGVALAEELGFAPVEITLVSAAEELG